MRFALSRAGVQTLPQVSRAGSLGSAWNRAKTVMLSRNRSTTINATRRTRYAATAGDGLAQAEDRRHRVDVLGDVLVEVLPELRLLGPISLRERFVDLGFHGGVVDLGQVPATRVGEERRDDRGRVRPVRTPAGRTEVVAVGEDRRVVRARDRVPRDSHASRAERFDEDRGRL